MIELTPSQASSLTALLRGHEGLHDREVVAKLLNTATSIPEPHPSWPSDASVRLAGGVDNGPVPGSPVFESERAAVREVLLADPIIEAAVAWCNDIDATRGAAHARLRAAIKDAGL